VLEAKFILATVRFIYVALITRDVADKVGERVVPDALNASRAPGVATTEPGVNRSPLTSPS